MGGGLPQCMLGYHPSGCRLPRKQIPPEQTPPGADPPPPSRPPKEETPPRSRPPPRSRHIPPGADIPPTQCMLGDTIKKRAVCILLECNLVLWSFSISLLLSLVTLNVFISFEQVVLTFHESAKVLSQYLHVYLPFSSCSSWRRSWRRSPYS